MQSACRVMSCTGTVLKLGTRKHHDALLKHINSFDAVGCFALTCVTASACYTICKFITHSYAGSQTTEFGSWATAQHSLMGRRCTHDSLPCMVTQTWYGSFAATLCTGAACVIDRPFTDSRCMSLCMPTRMPTRTRIMCARREVGYGNNAVEMGTTATYDAATQVRRTLAVLGIIAMADQMEGGVGRAVLFWTSPSSFELPLPAHASQWLHERT
jgi:hypothetical protein